MPNLVNLFNNEKKRFAAETKEQIPDGKEEKTLANIDNFIWLYLLNLDNV
jgi:hypothetical protein